MNQQSSTINNTMIRDCIIRAKRPSYEFRQQQRATSALVTLAAFAIIGFVSICACIFKGCSPDPVPAYSLCEQCGELIGDGQQGSCFSHRGTEATELASINPINPVNPVKNNGVIYAR